MTFFEYLADQDTILIISVSLTCAIVSLIAIAEKMKR